MKFINRIFCFVCAVVALASCVESEGLTFEEAETIALEAWIQKNRPDLIANFQPNGGYYVELLDEGVADSAAVRTGNNWIWFDVTCRDLAGNIVMTRNSDMARMQSSYTDYTHYVPYFLFCGEEHRSSLPEGIYMSLRNKLWVNGQTYSARYGTKMRIYMPSSIGTKSSGMKGDGGYEGQYKLDAKRPMIAEINVYGHVGNPVAYEDRWVQAFAEANGGLAPLPETKEENDANTQRRRWYMRTEGDAEAEKVYDEKWYMP